MAEVTAFSAGGEWLRPSSAGIYAAAAAVAAAGSWALVRFRNRVPIVDVPNHRSSHDRPTPRSGGVALFLGVLAGVGLFALTAPKLSAFYGPMWAGIALGAGGFFVLGLLDDIYRLPEGRRFLGQVALALVVAVWGPRLRALEMPGLGFRSLPAAASIVLTSFWYVGFINLFNFMDGTDGMAAGETALAGIAIALLGGGPLPFLAAAAAAGFLIMNYPPADIFMGDGGSYLLGYLLAVSSVIGASGSKGSPPFAAFVLILGSFVVDTAVTLTRRICRREAWYKAHRSHYYQKLTDFGFSHANVFWLNVSLTAALSASAFAYASVGDGLRLGIVVAWTAAFGVGLAWIDGRTARMGDRCRKACTAA